MLNIIKGVQKRAQKVVVYGPEGIGKSTFASKFPRPLFLDTEGSTDHMNVDRLDKPQSWTGLLQMVRELANMPMGYQSLIIDTIDWAESLCIKHICDEGQKSSIADFGYGSGYVKLEAEMGKLLNELERVIDAGINIVFTAHCQLKKFEQPDELGAYDRYELKLGNKTTAKTSALIKEWADAVLFVNYKNNVITTTDGKRKATQGRRYMYTSHMPTWDAKNRWGLPDVCEFDYKIIEPHIPDDIIPKELEPYLKGAEAKQQLENNLPQTPATEVVEDPVFEPVQDIVPDKLKQLLLQYGVSIADLKAGIFAVGGYPVDTLIQDYRDGYIDGAIIAGWDKLYPVIKQIKKEKRKQQ